VLFRSENLVGAAGQRQRNGDAERTGGLQVEEHLDFGGLLHRQIARLATFKNSPSIDSDEAMCFRNVGPVAHQTSGLSERAPLVNRGDCVLNREAGDLFAVAGKNRIPPITRPATSYLPQPRKSAFEVLSVLAFRTCSSMPRAWAADSTSRFCGSASAGAVGLTRKASTPALGSNSCSNSSRFGAFSSDALVTPVTLPPGPVRLATNPNLT